MTSNMENHTDNLLALLKPIGLDWRNTREHFRKVHGLGMSETGSEVIRFPAKSLITRTPLSFAAHWNPVLAAYPPEYVYAHFPIEGSLEETHRRALSELQEKLGAGTDCENSNTLIQKWDCGLLEVALYTWLPTRHTPPITGAQPKTAITITSELAFIHPDESLNFLSDLKKSSPKSILQLPKGSITCTNLLFTKIHPEALAANLPAGEVFGWRHGGQIGFSTQERSIALERTPQMVFILSDIKPARGPGGGSISIRLQEPTMKPESAYFRIPLFSGDSADSIRPIFESLLEFYKCGPIFEEDFDD